MIGGMLIAAIIFLGSILGIVLLFGFKYWEQRTQRMVAAVARERADAQALRLKGALARSRVHLAKLPPNILFVSRLILREVALGAAGLARASERQAHRIADMVSHKHRFEKREPRSLYLKKMNEDIRPGTTVQGEEETFGEKENL